MRVLLIGAGSIAMRHAGILREIEPECEIVFMRRDAGNGVPPGFESAGLAPDLATAMAQGLDLAVVACPADDRAGYIEPLLAAGVPLYVEKPVALTAEACVRIAEALKGPSPPALVGCNLRFLPSLLRLRQLVMQGSLGTVLRADLQAGQWLPDWRPQQDYRESYSADSSRGGGVLLDLVHELDQARWLLGEMDVSGAAQGHLSSLEIRSPDVACALLRGRSGAPLVTLGLDYVARAPLRRYTLIGDGATAVWDLGARCLEVHDGSGVHREGLPAEAFDVGATYRTAWRSLLFAIRSGTRPEESTLEDGLITMRLALDCLRAAERGSCTGRATAVQ